MLIAAFFGVGFTAWNWLDGRLGSSPDAASLLQDAQQAFNRGDLDAAIDKAQRAWDADPDDPAALVLLARALIYRSYEEYDRGEDRTRACTLTTAAYARQPGHADIRAIHAFVLQATGDAVRAAQIAEATLADDPAHIMARIARGLAYARVGSYEIALRENRAAAEIDSPWRMDALRATAISYSDLGRYDAAMTAIDAAITLNSRLIALHFERALYALQQGNTGAATVAYFNVLAFDPENIKARLRMCEVSTLLRETATALDYCRQVIERAPDWSQGWYRLGREYYLQGRWEDAQAALNRCSTLQVQQNIPITGREFQCWYLQGQAAEILGDCPSLLTIYNQFRAMAAEADLPQTWTYPPEGPGICLP